MLYRKALFLSAATALAASGSYVRAQAGGGPTATYWVTAETTSGMGAMMGRGAGGMMSAMMSGRAPPALSHALILQLGSSQKPAGDPSAEHLPPTGLGAGPSLPLVTPVRQAERPGSWPTEKPKGKMLIYWGCGEHAGPGQPVVLDFAKLAAGQAPPAFTSVSVQPQVPPGPGRTTTYGEWPNERSRTVVPATGSLVGDHVVRGNYTPDIKFTLAPGQDFLPALAVRNSPVASGAVQLNWQSISAARAYFAGSMGAKQDGTIVVWSSSAVQMPGMALPDFMSDGEIARLINQKVLMSPQTTQCVVPAEVAKAVENPMLQLMAYGPEANFSHPARPANAPKDWHPDWTVKVRTKSVHVAVLGMEMPDFSAMNSDAQSEPQDQQQQQPPPKKKKKGLFDAIGGIPIP